MGIRGLTGFGGGALSLSLSSGASKDYWSLGFRANAYDSLTGGLSNGPRFDSSGNVYSAFYFDDSSGNSERLAGLLKTNSEGVLQWAMGYTSTATTVSNYGFDVSSAGNIFYHIRQGNTYIEQQQLATDGTTTSWMRSIGAHPNDNIQEEIACRIGASGGHYISGCDKDNINTDGKLALFKLDGSGEIDWSRALYSSSGNSAIPGRVFGIDSSENTYHAINYSLGAPGHQKASTIAKYNSSGSIQWKEEYECGSSAQNWDMIDLKGINCDSSGNSYAFGSFVLAGATATGILIKSNNSGTATWVKSIPTDSAGYGGVIQYGVAIDSSGNLYVNVTGRYNSDRNTIVVHKLNSSGVAQWSRELYYNAAAESMAWGYCSVDSNDNLYVTAYVSVSSVNRVYLLKVPSDGTGTGDYGDVTWDTKTTITTSDISEGTGYTKAASPLTDASLTQVEDSITISQTTISSPSLNNLTYPS